MYRLKLEELTKLQTNCTSSIARQKKRLQELATVLKKLGVLRWVWGGKQHCLRGDLAWPLPISRPPVPLFAMTPADPIALTCRCKASLPAEATMAAQELENQMKERQGLFFDMEAYLPKKNG